MSVTLSRPWLSMELGRPHRVLSWSLTRPGFVTADLILWREVRNADLPRDFDVERWLRAELAARGTPEAVTLLTSRDLDAYEVAGAVVEGVTAQAVATVGLSNAERVGTRLDRSGKDWGTINVALQVSCPLTDAALIAAPPGDQPFAGMHTPVGEAAGRAAYQAVKQGVTVWMQTVRREGVF